ncbi:MAG: DNRLRE domain-containing protein [Sedimentisphaerales bacterium]|nr:DNRLRE domain-containing protein [Sedimentisphaerales bacterium]
MKSYHSYSISFLCGLLLIVVLVGPAVAEEMTLILEPGKDNYINRCSNSGTAANYGAAPKLFVRSFDGIGCTLEEPKSSRTIIQFEIPDLKCQVSEATLRLYYYEKLGSVDPAGRTYEIRRLLNDWTEGTGTKPVMQGGTTLGSSWENRHNFGDDLAFPWESHDLFHIEDFLSDGTGGSGWPSLGGGDFPYTDCNGVDHWGGDEIWATSVIPAAYGWMEWDVTALVQEWNAGTYSNHGMVIRDVEEQWHSPGLYPEGNKFGAWFYSREYVTETEEDLRPCLIVTYDLGQPGDDQVTP